MRRLEPRAAISIKELGGGAPCIQLRLTTVSRAVTTARLSGSGRWRHGRAVRLGGRALPLAWRVKDTQGAIGFAEERAALEAAARLLRPGTSRC